MEKNQKIVIGVVVALVVIIGLVVFIKNMNDNSQPASTMTNNQTQTPPATTTPEQATTTPASSAKGSMAYTDAVVKYKDRRIQFTQTCQASPTNMVFKNPVTLMLDNRSTITQKITIAGKTYTIGSYKYTVITINQKTLPATLYANCNSSNNVATILMEK